MPKTKRFVVTVEDTITLRRRVEIPVDAATREAAEELALSRADDAMGNSATVHSEQIDATPYEAIACRAHRGNE